MVLFVIIVKVRKYSRAEASSQQSMRCSACRLEEKNATLPDSSLKAEIRLNLGSSADSGGGVNRIADGQ
jgi:hypothetical protein